MKIMVLVQLILFTISLIPTTAKEGDCSPWFFHDADNGTECVCSKEVSDKVVRCGKDTTAFLRIGVCRTYNSETEDTQIGPCPYILQCSNFSSGNYYFHLPKCRDLNSHAFCLSVTHFTYNSHSCAFNSDL